MRLMTRNDKLFQKSFTYKFCWRQPGRNVANDNTFRPIISHRLTESPKYDIIPPAYGGKVWLAEQQK